MDPQISDSIDPRSSVSNQWYNTLTEQLFYRKGKDVRRDLDDSRRSVGILRCQQFLPKDTSGRMPARHMSQEASATVSEELDMHRGYPEEHPWSPLPLHKTVQPQHTLFGIGNYEHRTSTTRSSDLVGGGRMPAGYLLSDKSESRRHTWYDARTDNASVIPISYKQTSDDHWRQHYRLLSENEGLGAFEGYHTEEARYPVLPGFDHNNVISEYTPTTGLSLGNESYTNENECVLRQTDSHSSYAQDRVLDGLSLDAFDLEILELVKEQSMRREANSLNDQEVSPFDNDWCARTSAEPYLHKQIGTCLVNQSLQQDSIDGPTGTDLPPLHPVEGRRQERFNPFRVPRHLL